jgi:hypothetical protein
MTTLMDSVRIEVPTRSAVQPAAPLDPPWNNASETRSAERSFEVGSRSGYSTQWDRLAMGRGQSLWREAT